MNLSSQRPIITLKVETFAGRNFRDFANFFVDRESLYPRNRGYEAIRESLYPRNHTSALNSRNVVRNMRKPHENK